MKRGFYVIMAAQFFSSLADNALLIAAIALLRDVQAPAWMTPMLKLFFVFSYVALAAFVGAFADSFPKARVMFITNMIKVGGCLMMFLGFTSAACVRGDRLWRSRVFAGEVRHRDRVAAAGKTGRRQRLDRRTDGDFNHRRIPDRRNLDRQKCLSMAVAVRHAGHRDRASTCRPKRRLRSSSWIYVLAAAINLMIGDTGARYVKQHSHPWKLLVGFVHCCKVLWRDKLGQISLAVTTLFWGAGATLQFIVLKWAESVLGLDLARAAILQAVVAVGITMGAVYAAATVSLKKAMNVLPVGIAMGVIVAGAAFYSPAVVPEGAIRLGTINASYFLLIACANSGVDRHAGRLLRRPDERAVATPRPRAAVCRAFDRGAEL